MRAKITLTALTLIVSIAAAQTASAQTEPEFNAYHPSSPYTTPTHAPTPPTAPMHHSSTVHEGVGRAIAGIMKAHADGMLSYAQARILIAEARAREYQLRVVNTSTHLTRKQMLEEAREAERARKWEREQQSFARRQVREETVLYTAYRLPAAMLDRATGRVAWPATLDRPEFAEKLADLNSLFAQLAADGAQYDRLYRDPITDLCDDLRNELKRNREALELNWQDYLASQKLLVGLKYEAENWRPAGAPVRTLASR